MTAPVRTSATPRSVWISLSLLLIGAAAGCPSALGQQPSETRPGFRPNEPVESRGVDNVNVFNGDPGVAIPLGPAYPLGPANTWQLTAYYSAKFWRFDNICGVESGARHAYVSGYPTLGAGWTLELGYVTTGTAVGDPSLGAAGVYVSPDGGRHPFYNQNPPYETRDGTNLRVTKPTSNSYKVEFPDGTIHKFNKKYTRPTPTAGTSYDFTDLDWDTMAVPTSEPTRYGLSSIEDRSGTLLSVVYLTTMGQAKDFRVSIITLNPDSPQPRTINFTWLTHTVGSVTWPVLRYITFPTANGSLLITSIQSSGNLVRNGYDNSHLYPCSTGGNAQVPLLTSIGLTGSAVSQLYTFTYHFTEQFFSSGGGLLASVTLPTKGTIQYQYDATTVTCFGMSCEDPETGQAFSGFAPEDDPPPDYTRFWDNSAAVILRTENDSFSGLQSVTSYDRYQHVPLLDGVTQDDQVTRRVIVTAPSGNATSPLLATRYVFHTQVLSNPEGTSGEIARRYYEDEDASVSPIRTVVSCHGTTQPKCGYRDPFGQVQSYGLNAKVPKQASVTWYGVNPSGAETCSSSYSTLCTASTKTEYSPDARNFKETTITSTLPGVSLPGVPDWERREVRTEWSPNTPNWLLELYTARSTTDTGGSAPTSTSTSYTFSSSNGFLQQTITSDGGNGTLTRTFTPDALGNPLTETVVGTSGLTGQFTDTRMFQTGLVNSTQRTGVPWRSFDVERNNPTGLVTVAMDPNASLQTAYAYDALSRPITITPPGEVPTGICYAIATAKDPAVTIVKKSAADPCTMNDGAPPPGSGSIEAYQYDGFGRPIRAIRRLPNLLSTGSYFARQETRYDGAGHVAYRTEWHPCPTGGADLSECLTPIPPNPDAMPGTRWSDFDPFGRARLITRADGTTTTISFTDGSTPHSDSLQSSTVTINGAAATTVTRTDALGRIIQIVEPAVGGVTAVTDYSYNALDKLARVSQHQPSTGTTQLRSFVYDAFGFLKTETHPESGATTYGPYNVFASPGGKTEAGVTHTFSYDPAGRLLSHVAGGQTYLTNCYDGSGACAGTGGTYKLGKLTKRVGYNPRSPRQPSITEQFTYESNVGQNLTTKTTLLTSAPATLGSITETWTYNGLGLVASYGLPVVGATPDVTIGYEYVSGTQARLTSNGEPVVNTTAYNPAGMLASWTAGSGLFTTTIQQDSSLLPRPASISATVGGPYAFNTGPYAYDAAGNITSIGGPSGDTFTYDGRSRLVSALISGVLQSFEYDRYGNITNLAPADAPTNRLLKSAYELRGNLLTSRDQTYGYDELSRQIKFGGGAERYLYDGQGERIARVTSTLPGLGLWTINPCRAVDTRFAFGTPGRPAGPLAAGERLDLQPSLNCPIPATAEAVTVNLAALSYGSPGFFSLKAAGVSDTIASTLNFNPSQVRANLVTTTLSNDGKVALSASAAADAILDVVGYHEYAGAASNETWYLTLRNAANQLATEYTVTSGGAVRTKNYFHLGSLLVATREQSGLFRYYVSDHLGTPRLVTDHTGAGVEGHKYFAFGGELSGGFGGAPLKFATMERDLKSGNDYNHARYQSSLLGRFLSPDVVGGTPEDPQSWNRYAYALNNPLKLVDPDGRAALKFEDYVFIAKETVVNTVDRLAFLTAQPLLRVGAGILNADPGQVALGAGELVLAGAAGGVAQSLAGPAAAVLTRVRLPNPYAPVVENRALQNAIDALYKIGQKVPGGLAGAIRVELSEGVKVGGRSHITAGFQRIANLTDILKTQKLSGADRAVALRELRNLQDALRRVKVGAEAR